MKLSGFTKATMPQTSAERPGCGISGNLPERSSFVNMFLSLMILALLALIFPVILFSYESGKFSYVSVNNCKNCHDDKKILNQYSIWLTSPHAGAFKTLMTDNAKKIAKAGSIENPTESLTCLKCHTTGGGKYPITRNEGVGCESCHGPGSEYFAVSSHVDLRSRVNGYIKAKKFGMFPILKYEENLKKRERLCMYCHTQERPCWPTDVENIRRQKITIQVIDSLRKGDVKFYHSIRRY